MFASGDTPSQEKFAQWKGTFIDTLTTVQKQVHSQLSSQTEALEYIEVLMIRLLINLCSTQPHTKEDVDERISKTFPDPIDKWAIRDAQNAVKDGKKKKDGGLPVEKIQRLFKDELGGYRVDSSLACYIVAVLEYIAADILKISGLYVKNIKRNEITKQDIKVAIYADQVLYDMFFQEDEPTCIVQDDPVKRENKTYEEIVKDIIVEETQYLRDLNMIIKVFRAPFTEFFPRTKDLDVIFSNIPDIYDFTAKLLSTVEDQVEMTQEGEVPLVGTCFTDLTENVEFSVYEKYVRDMMAPQCKMRLDLLLTRGDFSNNLRDKHNGFYEAFKYVLPKLLMGPVYHCLQYFEVVKTLKEASQNDEDKECLIQADGLLQALKTTLGSKLGNLPQRKNWEVSLRMHSVLRSTTVQKMNEIQKSIDGWDCKDISNMCSEFIMEGPLNKVTGRRISALPERYVFLFDALIVLCKTPVRRDSRAGPGRAGPGTGSDFKFKEKFFIMKVEVVDKEDTEDLKNVFEIRPRESSHVVHTLQAKTVEEKTNWMAALVSLQTRSMLERTLDGKLREEEKNHPLVPPPAEMYPFAEEDSVNNIIFEESQESEIPLIKGGKLFKLVERLTYHMYADPSFVRTFLLTYRSFCTPQELIQLLIKRFDIPEPSKPEDHDENAVLKYREDLKRFRNEYIRPVQLRVANVFRHWVDNHFYDFERDAELLDNLSTFLQSIKGKAMRKMADSISKSIQRRLESSNTEREYTYKEAPPKIEWHLTHKPEDLEFNLMTLHPVEIARQVTLIEFDLYRSVKLSELVGMPWTKKDKHKTAPNLLKLIHFSNKFSYWLQLQIVETKNIEERVSVMSRIIEIMQVFLELNNFNGVLEIVGALNSASVFRLEHTKKDLHNKYQRYLEDASELNQDHSKKYIEMLRSINPPCVPFLGMYLTNILKTEEGNPDFVANAPEGIINFSKRRKVAEITSEIQQYQNQPYCLHKENSIRDFFFSVDPLREKDFAEKEFEDYLYKTSLKIEPRDSKPRSYPKRFIDYSLKSPGLKLSSQRGANKSSSVPPQLPKMSEEEDLPSPSLCHTPTSPKPPHSPGMQGPNNVFTNSPDPSSSPSASSIMQFPTLPSTAEEPSGPPPLPPRHRGSISTSYDRPPPVPPRHHSLSQHNTASTTALSRSQSVSLSRSSQSSSGFSTLPRQSIERHSSEMSIPVNANDLLASSQGDRPELPPRTYRRHLPPKAS